MTCRVSNVFDAVPGMYFVSRWMAGALFLYGRDDMRGDARLGREEQRTCTSLFLAAEIERATGSRHRLPRFLCCGRRERLKRTWTAWMAATMWCALHGVQIKRYVLV